MNIYKKKKFVNTIVNLMPAEFSVDSFFCYWLIPLALYSFYWLFQEPF